MGLTSLIALASVGLAQANASYLDWPGFAYPHLARSKTEGRWISYPSPASMAPTHGGTWPVKLVFVRRWASVQTIGSMLYLRRSYLIDSDVAEAKKKLELVAGAIRAATGGAADCTFSYDEVTDRMQDWPDAPANGFDPASYFITHVNGGVFQADDGVYRGPFGSVLFVTPDLSRIGQTLVIPGTTPQPHVLSMLRSPTADEPFELAACKAILGDMRARSIANGGGDEISSQVSDPDLLSLGSIPTETYLRRIASPREAVPPQSEPMGPARHDLTAPKTLAELVPDPDQGTVLKVTEQGPFRTGLVTLPTPDWTVDSRELEVTYKVASTEPIALTLFLDDGTREEAIFGTPSPAYTPPQDGRFPLALTADGAWHTVRQQFTASKGKRVVGLALGAPECACRTDRPTTAPLSYEIAKIDLAQVPREATAQREGEVAPDPQSASYLDRAMAVSQMTEQELLAPANAALLKDQDETVRLNVLARLSNPPLDLLSEDANRLEPIIAEAAIGRLSPQNPQQYDLLRSLENGATTEEARRAAAIKLATLKQPNLAAGFSALLAARSGLTRATGAWAIAQLPGDDAQAILGAFLQDTDATVRYAAIQGMTAASQEGVQRLLWNSVNDPSDAIRALAAAKLAGAGGSARKEGLKCVRDESLGVRLRLLSADAPLCGAEARRLFALLAVTDEAPEVRAAALHVLAACAPPVELAEVQNVLKETDPRVLLALGELAKAKGIPLPAATLQLFAKCPDPAVAALWKELTR